jgi:hypothetical protein
MLVTGPMSNSFPIGFVRNRSVLRFTTSTFRDGFEFGLNFLFDTDCPLYVSLQLGKVNLAVSFFERCL